MQHIRRGERIAALIQTRWQIQRPEQWRAKHLRWVLERGLGDLSPESRYHYYRTARVLAATLGHWLAWEAALRGPWMHPAGLGTPKTRDAAARGGRPPKLAHHAKLQR